MKTFLKISSMLLIALFFSACSKGGSDSGSSDSGSPSPVIDSTPHNYRISISRASTGVTGLAEMKLICDFGLSTEVTGTMGTGTPLNDGNPSGALAYNGCKNATIEIKNVGAVNLIYYVEIDGVPFVNSLTLTPGQVYNLQRGF